MVVGKMIPAPTKYEAASGRILPPQQIALHHTRNLAVIFNSVLIYDRTTLCRRRIDVMVGSPSENYGKRESFLDFSRAACDKRAWVSPIQHEQGMMINPASID